jgi:hypothetical protein
MRKNSTVCGVTKCGPDQVLHTYFLASICNCLPLRKFDFRRLILPDYNFIRQYEIYMLVTPIYSWSWQILHAIPELLDRLNRLRSGPPFSC